jgi:hypothetical protein
MLFLARFENVRSSCLVLSAHRPCSRIDSRIAGQIFIEFHVGECDNQEPSRFSIYAHRTISAIAEREYIPTFVSACVCSVAF